MMLYLKMRLIQILETMRQYRVSYVVDHIIFIDREAVPVEKDLTALKPWSDDQRQIDEKIVEITIESITSQLLLYPLRNRYLKALHYLKKGYSGYALVKGNKVSGDIWSSTIRKADNFVHPDVKWLGLSCGENGVYTFDMYLDHRERGKNLAIKLQNGALYELRKKGFSKAYGYFWANNIPALWVHRTLKWKELRRVKVSRFLFFRKVTQ